MPNTFPMMISLAQKLEATRAMLGEASTTALRLLEKALGGGWEMERESTFGKTSGSQPQLLTK